ncbi:unnamed protein product [Pleuronectes platessa]|uniref:Ankyrin-2 n=1 Tax=Pleuronectes platessa TaxID=8262 RepID=A0A9N7Z7H5_PLEPL|nr:unnamed protein product [Pleuronectes platessa]
MSKEEPANPDGQMWPESDTRTLSHDERKQLGSEAESISTLQNNVCAEDVRSDFAVRFSPAEVVKRKEEEVLDLRSGEVKSETANQRAPPQTPEDTKFLTGDEVQSASAAQDTRDIVVLLTGETPMESIPLQLPAQTSNTTRRTVTPVLLSSEKTFCVKSDRLHEYPDLELSTEEAQSSELFSPMSSKFLVPPDYEAVFSGHQTLRVSECTRASLNDLSPTSPAFSDSAKVGTEVATKRGSETDEDLEFSPGFNRVLSEFEKMVSELESEELKVPQTDLTPRMGSKSPQLSDSDVEFFDCRQALSDDSESEDLKLDHEIGYHISEPPSPMPGSSPDIAFLKGSPKYTSRPLLRVEDYKRFSSGSESLGEFAYDSEGSRTEGYLPGCEELPSRDQAGYYDDDDFLGREIAEELGMLSSDSSEEEVLTTRVVRRRVIIQADNLPDIPPQTVTEEKYTDEQGNMVTRKITRKVIRKYVSADGMESQEVTIEGSHQETVQIEEGDTVSRVVKRTVLHSEGDQKELTFSEPRPPGAATASEFEMEPVQGRKTSPQPERTLRRSHMRKSRTQKRTVVRDARGKHVHLERLDDTPDAQQADSLQQHLHRLLQHYCEDNRDEEEEEEEEKESLD